MSNIAKAIAALLITTVGAGLTATLPLISPGGTTWIIITAVVAALTALGAAIGVYAVPNVAQLHGSSPDVTTAPVEQPAP